MDLRILQRNGSDRLDVYYKEDLLIRLVDAIRAQ